VLCVPAIWWGGSGYHCVDCGSHHKQEFPPGSEHLVEEGYSGRLVRHPVEAGEGGHLRRTGEGRGAAFLPGGGNLDAPGFRVRTKQIPGLKESLNGALPPGPGITMEKAPRLAWQKAEPLETSSVW
jgi:hypothetical protein